MKLVLFCHPTFLKSQSMPRFAKMIGESMTALGHDVAYWSPKPYFYRLAANTRFDKWAGYLDQYLIFPMVVKWRASRAAQDTLFVFCDQALGPWVPLVKHRPHVVHAHDLLALRSALGLVPQNPTGFTGRIYQRYIRWGFRQAKRFVAVSKRTRSDLAEFAGVDLTTTTVVFNGLNYPYRRVPTDIARHTLAQAGMVVPDQGMLLHVGGDQWYKNTAGIIRIYADYASRHSSPLPLWMVGPPPRRKDVIDALSAVPSAGQVQFFQGVNNETLQAAYSVAKAFLFPSLAEGFGWPIIEAQACGCPVVTTDDAPMNEIGGPDAIYLPVLKAEDDILQWAQSSATALSALLAGDSKDEASRVSRRMDWASRFTQDAAIEGYLAVYRDVAGSFD